MTANSQKYPAYVCWHEAGHAVAAEMICGGFRYARVAPRGETLPLPREARGNVPAGCRKVCRGIVDIGVFRHTRADAIDWATIYMAGLIAESIASRKALTACAKARGLDDIKVAGEVCGHRRDTIDYAIKLTRWRVRRWWPLIERVATHLRREGILFGRDFERVAAP